MRVLVVDDNPTMLEILKLIFENSKFEVVQANSGTTGYAEVMKAPPALVVTDTNMPNGNGLELLAKIKKSHPNIKVIVLFTYLATDEKITMSDVYGMGADLVFSKPFWAEELMANSLKLLDLI